VFELDRHDYPAVSRSTVYRVLVRYQLIEPVQRRKRRSNTSGGNARRPTAAAVTKEGVSRSTDFGYAVM